MKQYQEQQDPQNPGPVTGYTIDGMLIPVAPGNRHYDQLQAELVANPVEAEILPWVAPPVLPPEDVVVLGDVVAAKKFVLIDEFDVEHDVTAVILALLP